MDITLYYYNYPNVGDLLSKIIIESLFNYRIKEEQYVYAEMVAIGSVLDCYLSEGKIPERLKALRPLCNESLPTHVWGTGAMHCYDSPQKCLRPLIIHALRGRLTKQLIEISTGKEYKCPLADPGLLASKLLEEPVEKKFTVGIIPHYYEFKEYAFTRLKEYYSNSALINVQESPLEVVKQIAQCECILSSSLHGLIIADSFGIPSQWCVLTDKVAGNGFKFRDYYSSFDLSAKAIDLNESVFPSVDEIFSHYAICYDKVLEKQEDLIKCFPYK